MANNPNDPNNDFQQDDFNDPVDDVQQQDAPVDQRQRMMDNVKEAWRTQPFFKLLVLMIAVAAVIAAVMSLTSTDKTAVPSSVTSTPDLNEPPGGQASQAFIEASNQAAAQRAAAAMKTGDSALPTPVGEGANFVDPNDPNKPKGDPLAEFREELARQNKQRDQQIQVIQQQVKQQPAQQFDDKLEQAMRQQMAQLIEGWQPKQIVQVAGTVPKDEVVKGADNDKNKTTPVVSKIIVPAGTVNYAQMLTEANSDVPGPILAQILSGPLAGARAVGTFQYYEEYLVLSFNLVSFKGKDYQVNAIALDPDTTLGGVATEVDKRYFTRVILPAAAAFAQGFGSALSSVSSTTTSNNNTIVTDQAKKGVREGIFEGMSQAGQTIGQFLQKEADATKTLVRVAAGTPVGIFFVSSVADRTEVAQPQYMPYAGGYYGAPGTGVVPGAAGGVGQTAYGQVGYTPQAGVTPAGTYPAGASVTNFPQNNLVPPATPQAAPNATPTR
jgi:intracellular multiplication protein IcmE